MFLNFIYSVYVYADIQMSRLFISVIGFSLKYNSWINFFTNTIFQNCKDLFRCESSLIEQSLNFIIGFVFHQFKPKEFFIMNITTFSFLFVQNVLIIVFSISWLLLNKLSDIMLPLRNANAACKNCNKHYHSTRTKNKT